MDHTRHSDIFNASKLMVTIVGVGGVGSATALCLAKMGVGAIDLYDHERVDEENLATQMFKMDDLGEFKVKAAKDLIEQFSDDVEVWENYYEIDQGAEEIVSPIVISAVDSIRARKAIFNTIVGMGEAVTFIDTRMSSESLQILTITKEDWPWYVSFIGGQSDENIPDEPCTSKATIYTAFQIAGMVGATVRKIITGVPVPKFQSFNVVDNTYLEIK